MRNFLECPHQDNERSESEAPFDENESEVLVHLLVSCISDNKRLWVL